MRQKANIPEWIKKAQRATKARENYFMKRYGNLKRMHEKDASLQDKIDKEMLDEEIALCESIKIN